MKKKFDFSAEIENAEAHANREYKERYEEENKLLKAKTEQLKSQKRTEELFEEAIKAMRNYGGHGDPDEY